MPGPKRDHIKWLNLHLLLSLLKGLSPGMRVTSLIDKQLLLSYLSANSSLKALHSRSESAVFFLTKIQLSREISSSSRSLAKSSRFSANSARKIWWLKKIKESVIKSLPISNKIIVTALEWGSEETNESEAGLPVRKCAVVYVATWAWRRRSRSCSTRPWCCTTSPRAS